jgi:hypothetical protein
MHLPHLGATLTLTAQTSAPQTGSSPRPGGAFFPAAETRRRAPLRAVTGLLGLLLVSPGLAQTVPSGPYPR